MNIFLGLTAEQWFTLLGIIIALFMGGLNWYDRRVPRMNLTPLESGQVSESLNRAIELANKRAYDAEQRASRLEELYEALKIEFEDWINSQKYRITFDVTLGIDPKIIETKIYHDRRKEDLPYMGTDRRS